MAKFGEDFTSAVNGKPLESERDLPGSFPTDKKAKEKLTAHYGKFVVGQDGSPGLEAIMNDCLSGKAVLANEQWHFTKEGDAVVIIKYLVPSDQDRSRPASGAILGRRRIKKAGGTP
jgi:hypothetical protein